VGDVLGAIHRDAGPHGGPAGVEVGVDVGVGHGVGSPVAAAVMAVQTRSGVAGMSTWRTPRWASASTTADWTAGVAPIVPDSPMPLAPGGFTKVGVSMSTSSKLGSSVAEMAG